MVRRRRGRRRPVHPVKRILTAIGVILLIMLGCAATPDQPHAVDTSTETHP